MGRKSTNKHRKDNPIIKMQWVKQLMPMFYNNGLKDFNMAAVAKELGKSKATVYAYFASREEILEMMVLLQLSKIEQYQTTLGDDSKPFVERYYEATKILMDKVSDISNIFLKDLKQLYPSMFAKITVFREYAVTVLSEFYAEGIQQGHFRNVNLAILTASDRMFFEALTDPDFLIEHNLSLESAFDQYFRMKSLGILIKPDDQAFIKEL